MMVVVWLAIMMIVAEMESVFVKWHIILYISSQQRLMVGCWLVAAGTIYIYFKNIRFDMKHLLGNFGHGINAVSKQLK